MFPGRTIQFLSSPAGRKYCKRLGRITGEIVNSMVQELTDAGLPSELVLTALAPATPHILVALSQLPRDDKEAEEDAKEAVKDKLRDMLVDSELGLAH